MNIKIAWFSGTGCTRYVAEVFKNEIEARHHTVRMYQIGKDHSDSEEPFDRLIVCYVVHACNAPKPVIDWVCNQKQGNSIPTAVISVSGGGEVTPNMACRTLIKKKLSKKNYSVFYEKMMVMPSNWIVSTKAILVNKLLDVLPYKVSYSVNEILTMTRNLSRPGFGNRIISMAGRLEHSGAIRFGKNIKVSDSCNSCGLCASTCPVGNIELVDGKPVFSNRCTLCLQCIYGCPHKALSPGMGKLVVIKDGFNFKKLLADRTRSEEFDIKKEIQGFLWLGIQRYLLNTQDLLEPIHQESV